MIVTFSTPTLETERLVLRGPKFDDFEPMRAFYATDRSSMAGGPITDLRQAWNAFAHITGMWALRGFGTFIVTLRGNDTAVGAVGPYYPINWPEKELGWTCWDAGLEGKGLMFEAASATRDFAFRVLGWDTAVSYIETGNTRSVALAERLGAVLDPNAVQPKPDAPCLVYRHPMPEAA
ncbi:GNAT family N-acetyltransferase [Litoreibacter janthinus]|uniref:Protein N-acetyltransferase, RimJ/RimL family n=1 Tax=Litoreibacter janthinus TaxID=670154 RepID=A0A1I6HX99_9RHOB|nr:GNAT family N-acetyltransferase [Litoreibacter janthinus]SFR59028.1 Protein N-acetyltransferase, RimJ/RimL family [Litoreibacter janthinus]